MLNSIDIHTWFEKSMKLSIYNYPYATTPIFFKSKQLSCLSASAVIRFPVRRFGQPFPFRVSFVNLKSLRPLTSWILYSKMLSVTSHFHNHHPPPLPYLSLPLLQTPAPPNQQDLAPSSSLPKKHSCIPISPRKEGVNSKQTNEQT